ncbi:RAMP superfamily CRISPR-associated protein [Photobacterium toruni]|uniref:RAMP superfamily protein n=1 Tax=Photobacterium toruni TaxID=1935446 RepID=A0A1T4UHD6_9GAMM|nr:RAMP superfamily CRISPR-associated protein [Photobacterium toruni]SKA51881.1 RAMP superfamily protein [Photobacterium toruni]
MTPHAISFAIQSPWHIGSGEEGGAYADSLMLKDGAGLPYVPGKSIKGLFREAFMQAAENHWFDGALDETAICTLFGQEGNNTFTQGTLHFSSATLSEPEQAYFHENAQSVAQLFRVVQSTAIDFKTGVAKNTSLRALEVAVPMDLQASVSWEANPYQQQLVSWLSACSCLILALGAKRHRGLGVVRVDLQGEMV